jgi:hypothetical protein
MTMSGDIDIDDLLDQIKIVASPEQYDKVVRDTRDLLRDSLDALLKQ